MIVVYRVLTWNLPRATREMNFSGENFFKSEVRSLEFMPENGIMIEQDGASVPEVRRALVSEEGPLSDMKASWHCFTFEC